MLRLAETLANREEHLPAEVAQIFAYAGDNDRALYWLERAFEKRDPTMPLIAVVPDFDELHDDPRFQDLLRRMKLPVEVLTQILGSNHCLTKPLFDFSSLSFRESWG
jgi:hypothetical protein